MFPRDWCHLGHGMRLVRGREERKGGKNGRKERTEGRTEEGSRAGTKKAAPDSGAAINHFIVKNLF